MRHRLTARRSKFSARVRYLWNDADPAPLELLCAALAIGFALYLLWPESTHMGVPRPPWFWAVVMGVVGVAQLLGVLNEWRMARMLVLIGGAGFWAAFAVIYGLSIGTPAWVLYATLAAGLIWALRRVVRP